MSRRLVSIAAALALLLLAGGCALGGVAVDRGIIAPPPFELRLGDARLIGTLSRIPPCSQLINPGCALDRPLPPARLYTVWLISGRVGAPPDVRRLAQFDLGARGAR